jgi:hypothetical protein
MKVKIHYQIGEDDSLHTSLKLTLPKKWEKGPTDKIKAFFLGEYNKKHDSNQLDGGDVQLQNSAGVALASDAVVSDVISDRDDLFVVGGASPTLESLAAIAAEEKAAEDKRKAEVAAMPKCTRPGCNKRFQEHENGDEACSYHAKPACFHETRKFWACCPDKVCYDWDTFLAVPGCCKGPHTTVPQTGASVMGGSDLRAEAHGPPAPAKMSSIADYNDAAAAGSASTAEGGGAGGSEVEGLAASLVGAGVEADIVTRAVAAATSKSGGDEAAAAKLVRKRIAMALEALSE